MRLVDCISVRLWFSAQQGNGKKGNQGGGHLNYSLSRKTFAFLFSRGCGFYSAFLHSPFNLLLPRNDTVVNHPRPMFYSYIHWQIIDSVFKVKLWFSKSYILDLLHRLALFGWFVFRVTWRLWWLWYLNRRLHIRMSMSVANKKVCDQLSPGAISKPYWKQCTQELPN